MTTMTTDAYSSTSARTRGPSPPRARRRSSGSTAASSGRTAFNHEEAVRCFERAAAADPACAMAQWGIAYASGPNYNKPWETFPEDELAELVQVTHAATERALALRRVAPRRSSGR